MAATEATEPQTSTLKVGDLAPDFTLPTHNEGELNLAWYRGRKNVVLAFYPGDWTPVCSSQIPGYQNIIEEFERYDTQLLAISVDSVPSHLAWSRSCGGFSFPLMADYYPHGAVARKFGVLSARGYAERAVFLIDKKGVVQYIEKVPPAQIPDNDELFRHIAQLER